MALQGVQQPLTVSWADPERRAQLKRKFAGEPEPERQVPWSRLPPTGHATNRLHTPAGPCPSIWPADPCPPIRHGAPRRARGATRCIDADVATSHGGPPQVFFAKVPRAATEADVMALFAGLGAVEDVVLFKASGAQHHKVGTACSCF